MKIAACQFAVSGDINRNMEIMQKYAHKAGVAGADLLIFPECALTGYPPLDIPSPSEVNFRRIDSCLHELRNLSEKYQMGIVSGTLTIDRGDVYNSAALILPGKPTFFYHKRALWGWDKENFLPGNKKCVFLAGKLKIGLCICYEVRFPEYFRELFRERTDLNIVLFHDSDDVENPERYEVLKAHLRTRASENGTPLLSVNTNYPFQTAPTAFFDRSGMVVSELIPGKEGLLLCDYQLKPLTFSERGRRFLSNEFLSKP